MKPGVSKDEIKSLWGILWRLCLFGPLLLPLGFALLLLVGVVSFGPFVYAIFLMFTDHPILGSLLGIAWSMILRLAKPLFERLLEGIEHGGI